MLSFILDDLHILLFPSGYFYVMLEGAKNGDRDIKTNAGSSNGARLRINAMSSARHNASLMM